jgi:putative ABC transport system permease protein
MVLLAGAAVMLRTLQEMNRADFGFQAESVLTFDMLLYAEPFRSQETRRGLVREIKEGIEALPGVEGLARSSMPPLSGTIWNRIYGWDQEILDRGTERADLTVSSQDYFRVMGTRLLAGRFFTPEEMTDSSSSIIVDEKLANMAWPGEDPIGKRVLLGGRGGDGVVVGVVEHMLMRDFGLESFEAIHYPEGNSWPPTRFVVRTALEPEALTPSIRRVLRSIHPTLVPFKIMSLSDRVSLSMAPTRFVVLLMGSFAGISFLVAITGLFGVIAYAVRTRTAELGIRMALGADRARILRLVLGKGALLTGIGIFGGLAGALALGRFIESVVFGVSPTDPLILGGAALVLGGVSILACCAPARWASRLPPAQVLRTQ